MIKISSKCASAIIKSSFESQNIKTALFIKAAMEYLAASHFQGFNSTRLYSSGLDTETVIGMKKEDLEVQYWPLNVSLNYRLVRTRWAVILIPQ